MAARKKATRPTPPDDVTQHAHKIADAVAEAWYGIHGSGRLDVPVSVVAVVAAAPQKSSQGADVTDIMVQWSPDDFVDYATNVWRSVIQHRPESTHLLYPILGWWFDEIDTDTRRHVHAVARAALRAGQVDLTGTGRRFEVDLLGTVLTVLRPKSALKAQGQFYTPPGVGAVMAGLSNVEEGGSVEDPTMGTGGLFRAVAEVMRQKGQRPSTMRWVGCDVDGLAVACATVNSLIWGLGRDIVFLVGSAFTPDWEIAATAQRDHLREIAAWVQETKYRLRLLGMWPEQ
ncbi:N-6 DNA methylase [Kibdelosporangium aridum]|uniref:N-6 DNA methylase n=1 Tax=Kibdelosporangium aridum TaxID=2030 RepID=UPI00068B0A24